jgi:hypothetical protein
MKIGLIICGLFLLLNCTLKAGDIKYSVADIPKELKENARSVIRNNEMVFEIKSVSNAVLKVTYAITILNKNGTDDALFHESYDKFSKISGVKGRVYDANGELIKKIPSDDIIDHSAISGYSTYEDRRAKFIDPKVLNVPFTVEYSYEKSFNELYIYPPWYPQEAYNVSVEKSSYKAIVPKKMTFRYFENKLPIKVKQTSEGDNNIYYWEVANLKAAEKEPFSVPSNEIFPYVLTAPSDFEFDGYKGNLSSWDQIGKWASDLSQGKDNLNEETIKTLQSLVANTNDDIEKTKKIYEYLQSRTRYVSIQIGIGGLQPFDASTVHRLAYGDCKALTNYLRAMLKAVGIDSKYCWVNAGERAPALIKDFPSDQFNHVFLCVPLKKDTLWLESTNQRNPFGYIGDFTDDRDVLLVDNEKSKIVHTKAYGLEDNKECRKSVVKLNSDGTGTAEIIANYKGMNYDKMEAVYYSDDNEKKRKISESIKFPSFQLASFSYKEHRDLMPSIDEKLQVNFENYLATMGSRQFLTLNFANRVENFPANVRSRKTDVMIWRPYVDIDTIIYQLPESLKPESIPNSVNIKNQFGEYHASAEFKDRQLYYIRSFQLNKGRYPASSYADFIDFLDKVSVADNAKCALIKNL